VAAMVSVVAMVAAMVASFLKKKSDCSL